MCAARLRTLFLGLAIVSLLATAPFVEARSVGQVIDDATIATQIKTKLVAEALSNLTHISVKVMDGVVTLSGEVDSAARRDRAVQIAGAVEGVKSVVDNVRVTGVGVSSSTPPASPSASSSTTLAGRVDASGTVERVDPQAKTITLKDGRVVKTGEGTVIWQPVPIASVQPGGQVVLKNVEPAGFQSDGANSPSSGWKMGTVSRVDEANGMIVLTDGTSVRVTPSTKIRAGSETVPISRVRPGAEVVVRAPAQTATIEASDVNVISAEPR